MRRVFEYLAGTVEYGHDLIFHDEDHKTVVAVMYADSDHAGDLDTRRSTSGWVCGLWGKSGSVLWLDWGSRRQRTVAHSTGEAEIGAINEGMRRSFLPLLAMTSVVLDELESVVLSDSSAARKCIENCGANSQLRYMRKHPVVSLAFLHDALVREETKAAMLGCVESGDNVADVFTKPLGAIAFVKFRDALCLSSVFTAASPRKR